MSQTKKPKLIETVGSLYYAFNIPTETGEFNSKTYDTITRSPIIKKVSVEPESDSTTVRASGEDYDTVNQTSSVGLEFETIAFAPEDLARAKGERVSANGLVHGGSSNPRPYMAIGYPVKKLGGGITLKWYPKCKLEENSEEANTSESSYSEQNPSLTIKAYSFNDNNEKYLYLDDEIPNFPENITEEDFFSQVITSDEQLNEIINNLNKEEEIEEA